MNGQFDDTLALPPRGDPIQVRGPLQIDQGIDGDIKRAKVHFLVIQGEGADTVIGEGVGDWVSGGPNEWTGQLQPGDCKRLDGTQGQFSPDMARGIGLAVAVKEAGPGDVKNGVLIPPAFQTLTWCAEFTFTASGVSA